ncbi:MAG: DUF192 domain-containing protein [bacterium]|nr:DUF192 domain-containing protein [bacterium]
MFFQTKNIEKPKTEKPKNDVCYKDRCFQVEIARTYAEHEKGLMSRESLPADHGMLFVFRESSRYSFWMKNTLIPLDIIWLDENGKVVYIKENTKPCGEGLCETMKPDTPALYVLEINSGKVKEVGLNVGDSVQFDFK